MTKKQQGKQAVELLEQQYPDADCCLLYNKEKPYELLIAVRLSAQCTDARVNMVTPALFETFPSLEALANASYDEVRELIKSCGLFKTKGKDIVELSKMLINDFGGELPNTIEQLILLPGIGRKTANLIMGDIFGEPSVVCDTHCIRITNLLGLTTTTDPLKTENELRACLPMDKANEFCHRLVLHGRAVCVARRQQCEKCSMISVCKYAKKAGLYKNV